MLKLLRNLFLFRVNTELAEDLVRAKYRQTIGFWFIQKLSTIRGYEFLKKSKWNFYGMLMNITFEVDLMKIDDERRYYTALHAWGELVSDRIWGREETAMIDAQNPRITTTFYLLRSK